jgi:hypothetical protein
MRGCDALLLAAGLSSFATSVAAWGVAGTSFSSFKTECFDFTEEKYYRSPDRRRHCRDPPPRLGEATRPRNLARFRKGSHCSDSCLGRSYTAGDALVNKTRQTSLSRSGTCKLNCYCYIFRSGELHYVTPLDDWPPEQCILDHGVKKDRNVFTAISNYTERVAAGEGYVEA